jgi:Copper type II ascorbate-dependent monooxygenase, C-terminal domain
VALTLAVGLVAGCTSTHSATPTSGSQTPASTAASSSASPPSRPSVHVAPLERGERWINLAMPGGNYRPQAEAGGTDDYRCILLDPKLKTSAFLSGVVLEPGNPKLVHHAILYRVDPGQVRAAQGKDATDPRLGWSCFGDPGLPGATVVGGLDSAPWVAAWATTGGEQRFAAGTGQKLPAGTRLILQIHYNLLNGVGVDNTAVKLRVAAVQARLQPLHTLLLPAPVELPCPVDQIGPLCDRTASIFDVARRFGPQAGATVAGLQLLCGGSVQHPKAGPTQSCLRTVSSTIQIRAVAGHMHLLGRSVRIDLLRADGAHQTVLDVKVWDFDNQRATVLAKPVTVRPGDRLRVTCTHDATLREKLPELKKLPPRYVVWGEGSSDEMCLGIVSYTETS